MTVAMVTDVLCTVLQELTAKVVNYSSLAKELDPAGSGGSRPKGTVPYGTSTRGSGRNPVQPHLKSYHDDSDVVSTKHISRNVFLIDA